MKLYTISGAPRGWRVQTALVFKELEYDLCILDASRKEHKSAPFTDINPRGHVPVVEFEGEYISDSLGIMAWLDKQFPTNPLFGETASQAAKIWSLATDLEDHMRHIHHRFVFPLLVEKKSYEAMQDAERKEMSTAAENLLAEFDLLEKCISKMPYIFGHSPSAADAVAFPDVRLIHRANEVVPASMAAFGFDRFSEMFPKIDRWKKQVESLPRFETCLPPHWSKA